MARALALLGAVALVGALSSTTRRALLRGAPAAALTGAATRATAADEENVAVYFGVGCFWHVQHEFAEAERAILGRDAFQWTARAGYAGGRKAGKDASRPGQSLVCYHNPQRIADYGKLGHGEVVGLKVPPSTVGKFAEAYAALFDAGGDRPDKGDRGGEYRSLVGLPGGESSPLAGVVAKALEGKGLKLARGSGDDGDTLGTGKVWLYDTAAFPFYQAEVYHQFHDGFMRGEQYGPKYNGLRMTAYEEGRLSDTGCPDIV